MAARMILETDIIEVKTPPVLLYGTPGTGKTSTAQTAPNPITLDFDAGAHRSAFRKPIMQFDSWRDVIEEQRNGTFDRFDTVVIDTVGTCLEKLSQGLIEENAKLGNSLGGLSQQGWGVLKNKFGAFLSSLKQAGKQVIMIAHQKEDKHGDNRMIRPDIAGGSYAIVMQSADIVGYLSYRNGKRFVGWEPTDFYFAKNGARLKSDAIPDFNAEPNYFSKVLTTAKANLGKVSEASAQTAAIVDDWKRKLVDIGGDLNAFNGSVPGIGALASAAKLQVWKCVTIHAEAHGWHFDAASKVFVVTPQEGAA